MSSWRSACAVLLYAVLTVCVPVRCLGQDVVPDHCLFIYVACQKVSLFQSDNMVSYVLSNHN